MRYGWVELLFLGENQGLPTSDIGNYITATTNGKVIAGSVVGISGDYVYVQQSDNDPNVPEGANSNFVTYTDENNQQIRTQGAGQLQATERCIIQNPEVFPKSAIGEPATLIREGGNSQALVLYQDNSNKAGIYSCLAPDLRGRIVWGAKAPDTFGDGNNDTDVLARSGGTEEFSWILETTLTMVFRVVVHNLQILTITVGQIVKPIYHHSLLQTGSLELHPQRMQQLLIDSQFLRCY